MDVPRRRESELQQLFNDIVKRIDSNSLEDLRRVIPIDEQPSDPLLLVQYIKQMVFYLSKMKMEFEDRLQRMTEDIESTSYERIIQKLEAEVRQHIRIEQQQRLHIESLQQRVDELVTENTSLEKQAKEVSSRQRLKSGSAAAEKINEIVTNSKGHQLPLQLQALFSKVSGKAEGIGSSQLSKRTLSRHPQSMMKSYDSCNRDETHVQSSTQRETHGPTNNVIRNLEAQFLDTATRDDSARGQQTQRDYQSELTKLKKALAQQQRKDINKSDLSKSSSFDGTSKMVKMYRMKANKLSNTFLKK